MGGRGGFSKGLSGKGLGSLSRYGRPWQQQRTQEVANQSQRSRGDNAFILQTEKPRPRSSSRAGRAILPLEPWSRTLLSLSLFLPPLLSLWPWERQIWLWPSFPRDQGHLLTRKGPSTARTAWPLPRWPAQPFPLSTSPEEVFVPKQYFQGNLHFWVVGGEEWVLL